MAKASANVPLQSVLRAVSAQFLRGAGDPELLRRFIASNDEAAFRVIAERHGPMVLGVCRRVLGCPYDAEDAFQATFLIFARKAASIRKTASVGGWLHGVAIRVASRLLRDRKRRLRHEQSPKSARPHSPGDDLTWTEVRTGLDDELHKLPDRYREVLVLCYLEGKTRDEAAGQLGLKQSVLHGRLERGRKLLADRLSKRGLTLSAGLLAIAVAPATVGAAVRAASLFAAGHSIDRIVTPAVLSITNRILKGMNMSKLKLAFVTAFCLFFLAVGVGFTPAQGPSDDPTELKVRDAIYDLRFKTVHTRLKAVQDIAAIDTDEAFIRRVSQDLRGVEPTPAEVHFFVNNKDAKKRDTLIDLFVKERDAKKAKETARTKTATVLADWIDARLEAKALGVLLVDREQPNLEVTLLKTRVEQAQVQIQEKEILLKLAQQKKAVNEVQLQKDAKQIRVLEFELEKARLQLEEAKLNLNAAEKKVKK